MELSKIKIGGIFTVADIEFIKLTNENGTCGAVSKEILFNSEFGKDNNFANSYILEKLNKEILPKLESAVGKENIKEFELELTSLDGLTTHGKIKTRIGLPTFDIYRKNVKIFDEHKVNKWWWTATPDTTAEHLNNSWITCVSPLGGIDYYDYGNDYGVRPFNL
ncbi:MAG: hypothetical protein J6D52_00115 [Clostridia bacterium]|nr:hypothetical protein [Clostridia bacterium]